MHVVVSNFDLEVRKVSLEELAFCFINFQERRLKDKKNLTGRNTRTLSSLPNSIHGRMAECSIVKGGRYCANRVNIRCATITGQTHAL
jgi:hypothetical protein